MATLDNQCGEWWGRPVDFMFDDDLSGRQQDAHRNALALRLCAIRASQELGKDVKSFLHVEGF